MRRWVDLQMRIPRRRRDRIASDHAYRFKITCKARSHSTRTLWWPRRHCHVSLFPPYVVCVVRAFAPASRQLSTLDWK